MNFRIIQILFITVFFVCAFWSNAQKKETSFELYTHLNGLSNSHVNCIIQDAKGFMWFGTDYGLNKFDGFKFVVYSSTPENEYSLPSNEVSSLYLDKNGHMWVGTYNGLAKFDYSSEKFINYFINKDSIQYYKPIRAITGDNKGTIWVGTSGKGVMAIDEKTGSNLTSKNKSLSELIGDEYVYALLIDKNNNLWIGTEGNGIKIYNPTTKKVKHLTSENSILKSNWILTLFEDKDGNIWIGTRGGGMSIFNSKTQEFTTSLQLEGIKDEVYSFSYSKDSTIWIGTQDGGLIIYNPATKKIGLHDTYAADERFKSKRIRVIFKDKDNNIWLGIHQLGISLIKNYEYPFRNPNLKLPKEILMMNYSILGIFYDSKNNLWLGTDGNGLIKFNTFTKKYQHYLPNSLNNNSLLHSVVRTIYEDRNKNIWIGTYKGGLSKYIESTDNFKNYRNEPNNPNSLGFSDVVAITEDKKGNLWIATNGGGLNLYNPSSDAFTRFSEVDPKNKSGICSDWLTCLFVDSQGFLWIGSFWGLSRFDIENKIFRNYFYSSNNANSLSDNVVYSINEDKHGNIWIGTKSGLNKLEIQSNKFTRYGTADGLPDDAINSILIDDKENFWISTNNGLSKFNYITKEVKNFYYQDGLMSNEFIHNSQYKSSDGQFFLGSVFGFNSFFPDSINVRDFFPKVYITEFKIFNKTVPIGKTDDGRVILKQSATEATEINLDYYDNSFSFDFVALDYILPERIMYACKMEGFEKDWNYSDYKRRFITYTNLDPGTYTFLVKASSRKDEWGEEVTRITINIRPPIWKTSWAYFIYLLLILGSGLFLWKLIKNRIVEKNQLRIERIKRDQVDKLNQEKLDFFTNISHEFRTPLTLIIGPIENLLENEKQSNYFKKTLLLMLKNAHRLLRLVNQLLDLRKIEQGKLRLQASKSNIIAFVRDLFLSFEELAKRKNIKYEFLSNFEDLDVYFDQEKLDKIIFNLLSNAFKFTMTGGKINLTINAIHDKSEIFPEGFVEINVEDNGQGMSHNDVNQIFERFYQSPDNVGFIQKGTGIGLSLTKSLVELHHGIITVDSKKGEGSIFKVKLPLGMSHLLSNEIFETGNLNTIENEHQSLIIDDFELESAWLDNGKEAQKSAALILLVDDNEDVRAYLKAGLGSKYQIAEADNGLAGIQKTHDLMPDLIISDVMMPMMDGIEFCRKIKTDLVTCHIPVILLTAKTSIEHRIEGLETGADSYIPKPFNPKHLLIRIEKLIQLRQVLKEKFKTDSSFEPVEMAVTSTDQKFMTKAVDLIKQRISDPELSVENLGDEIGMSRGHLHRKLKALTGQSPSEFIRTIRLKQAAYLLEKENIPVSEVTYLVGFSSPSYFTSCFNKFFGLTPTQFKEQKAK
jgi:signal transduction histidine kinase/ligand-binding sensor domain-containing protein/DNA-binding response OmpR family regulator